MSEQKSARQSESAAYWRGHLDRCAEQGLTVAAYARANGLPAWRVYQWKARLCRSESAVVDRPLFQAVRVVDSVGTEPTSCRVRFPNGVTVECGNLDAERLSVLLRQVSVV